MNKKELIDKFENGGTNGKSGNIFIDGDILYSYGYHFPLCVRYEDGTFIINGDKRSISTSAHQSLCFCLGPVIPFSALAAANINFRDIKMIDRREDSHYDVAAPTPEDPDHMRSVHVLGAVLFKYKKKYYLSSTDDNEHWRMNSYFLSLLPKEVKTVEEAFDSLMPDEIRRVIKEKGEYLRQGDWYFIPTNLKTGEIPHKGRTDKQVPIHGSVHIATEGRGNGCLYVRGSVRHDPGQSRSQHKRLTLGEVWHQVERNLAVDSWNAIGGID